MHHAEIFEEIEEWCLNGWDIKGNTKIHGPLAQLLRFYYYSYFFILRIMSSEASRREQPALKTDAFCCVSRAPHRCYMSLSSNCCILPIFTLQSQLALSREVPSFQP